MSRKTPVMERVIAGVTMFVAFLVMASIFVPDPSRADDHDDPAGRIHPAPGPAPGLETSDHHEGLESLGSLEHRLYVAVIYATQLGPRYSVYDRKTGEELGVLLSADEVAAYFPELPIPEMGDDGPIQIMMAVPDRP